jgi:L(+)-tartrate dehydratase alpha subunit
MILTDTLYQVAVELNSRAAIKIPDDARQAAERMYERATHKLSKYVLGQIVQNYAVAIAEQPPMCADTGLPRFYAKVGNEAQLAGGVVALERELRRATAAALEDELLELGNATGFGAMGFPGNGGIMDVHIEIAYAHTGGMPIAIQHFCFAHRRMTARIAADNTV